MVLSKSNFKSTCNKINFYLFISNEKYLLAMGDTVSFIIFCILQNNEVRDRYSVYSLFGN